MVCEFSGVTTLWIGIVLWSADVHCRVWKPHINDVRRCDMVLARVNSDSDIVHVK